MANANRNKLTEEYLAWQDTNDGRIAKVFTHNVSRKNKRGSLHIITEVSCPSQDGDVLVNALVPAIVKGYTDSRETHEGAFEDAITHANIVLKNMGHETTNTWFGNLHVAIGLIAGQRLYLSTVGNPGVLLVRGGKICEVAKKTTKEEPALNFENVSSGELVEEDVMLIYTPGLLEIFPLENLTHIIKQYEGFPISRLETLLEENRGKVNALFALLSLRCKKRSGQKVDDQVQTIRPTQNRFVRTSPYILSHTSHTIKTFLAIGINAIGISFSIIKKINIGSPISLKKRKGQILPPWHALIIILVLLLSLCAWSIFRNHNTETVNTIVDEMRTKIEKAENALIFNDKGLAYKNILEAKLLLARVAPVDIDSEEINILKQATEELENKILGTVTIENPKLIWEIKNSLGSPPTDFFISGNKLFAYSETQLVIHSKGDVEKLIFLPVSNRGSLSPGIFMKPQNRFILYASENGMLLFDPETEKYENLEATPKMPENFDAVDISYYHDYVYLLGSSGMIIKYRITDNGLQYLGEWLEKQIAVSSNPSFTIDGSIYITGENGTILKLTNGKILQEWKSSIVDFSKIKISTSKDLAFLYVIDMAGSSILKLSKDGEILNKYHSPKFKKLNDIFVDEKQNKMYVLDGFDVYEISI